MCLINLYLSVLSTWRSLMFLKLILSLQVSLQETWAEETNGSVDISKDLKCQSLFPDH